MRLLQSVMCGVPWFHVSLFSLLVVIAGRGDCSERERKAGEGESKA